MKSKAYIVAFAVLVSVIFFASNVAASVDVVHIEYFFGSGPFGIKCSRCDEVIREIETIYGNKVNVTRYDVMTTLGSERVEDYEFSELPAVAINQVDTVEKSEITVESLESIINFYLYGEEPGLPWWEQYWWVILIAGAITTVLIGAGVGIYYTKKTVKQQDESKLRYPET